MLTLESWFHFTSSEELKSFVDSGSARKLSFVYRKPLERFYTVLRSWPPSHCQPRDNATMSPIWSVTLVEQSCFWQLMEVIHVFRPTFLNILLLNNWHSFQTTLSLELVTEENLSPSSLQIIVKRNSFKLFSFFFLTSLMTRLYWHNVWPWCLHF